APSRRAARLPTNAAVLSFRPTSRSARAIGRHAGIPRSCMASPAIGNGAMAASVGHNRAPVLDVVNLKKHFPVKKGVLRRTVGQVYAVDDVTFRIGEGETLGLVGESGCGKSTVARTVLRLIEPTAVSIKAQVINLMMDLQREKRLSYLFIAHDLAVVEHISHRIAVMYLGKIVEYADKTTLFTNPLHPYTEALLSAVPVPNPKLKREKRLLQGDVPSPINPPPGCAFHTRCPYAFDRCKIDTPKLVELSPGHGVSCHLRTN